MGRECMLLEAPEDALDAKSLASYQNVSSCELQLGFGFEGKQCDAAAVHRFAEVPACLSNVPLCSRAEYAQQQQLGVGATGATLIHTCGVTRGGKRQKM